MARWRANQKKIADLTCIPHGFQVGEGRNVSVIIAANLNNSINQLQNIPGLCATHYRMVDGQSEEIADLTCIPHGFQVGEGRNVSVIIVANLNNSINQLHNIPGLCATHYRMVDSIRRNCRSHVHSPWISSRRRAQRVCHHRGKSK